LTLMCPSVHRYILLACLIATTEQGAVCITIA